MVLESTFICVDNSEFMRNGDFIPTRLQAQQDAVNLVTQTKLRSNPESNVGLMTLSELDVLVTLTTDTGKVLAKLHSVTPVGRIKFVQGIKIAHLALKHRQGKNHKTRIVAFVGSPVEVDEATLVKLAKKLKKEKVNVDIVSFGESDENAEVLRKFVETVNGKDGTGSHLVTIPPGPHLSDALISSPILQSEDGSGPNIVASGGGGFDFGVDPNEDPELALALRVSMEEQRARQEAESRSNNQEANMETGGAAPAAAVAADGNPDSEEALLQRALAMSMETDAATGAASAAGSTEVGDPGRRNQKKEGSVSTMTEEEQIAYAMRMSMQEEEGEASTGGGGGRVAAAEAMDVDDEGKEDDYSEAMNDPAYLQSVLENLPGVDPQSEAVKSAMGAITGAMAKPKPDEGGSKDEGGSSKDDDKKKQDGRKK